MVTIIFFLLQENKDWNLLIQDAHRRGALVKTKQQSYLTDVNRILKLNHVMQRTSSPATKTEETHKAGSSYTLSVEAFHRGMNNLADDPPPKKISHPAIGLSRIQNRPRYWSGSEIKVPSNAGPPPSTLTSSGRLRDPRLEPRREETNANTRPPDLQPGLNTNRSQSHSYHIHPHSAAGVKRPSQPSARDPWPRQPRIEDSNRDYESGKDQEPKKRKVS